MPQRLPETEEIIRARAYQYWLDEGRPHGRHEIHWQRALASVQANVTVPDVTPVSLMAAPAKPATAAPASVAAVQNDVSLIGGIGPKIKAQLAQEGITALAQIAALSAPALAALDSKLGLKGRSAREDWIAQAKELVAGKAPRAKTDKVRAKR